MTDSAAVATSRRAGSAAALALAGVAAVLASTCCVVPLLLAIIGVSGAWISLLRGLAPYSTALILMAVLLLGVVGWRLFWGPTAARSTCDLSAATCRTANGTARRWFWLVVVFTLIPVIVPLLAPLFY
jgi:mercuric ion transport protein